MSIRALVAGAAGLGLLALVLVLGMSPGYAPAAGPLPQPAPSLATAGASGGPSSSVVYDWPLQPEPEVLRGFEPPEQVWARGHRGADLGARAGTPVYAAADGVVAFTGRVVDRTVISIDHADGIRTTYEPVDPVVGAGDQVRAGAVIGHLARFDTGVHCGTDCLHWGARIGGQDYLDPLLLVGHRPVVIRLYPLQPAVLGGSVPGGSGAKGSGPGVGLVEGGP